MADDYLDVIRAPFAASLTARTLTAGTYFYSWVEQSFDPVTGTYQDATPPRSGTATVAPAVEVNNEEVDPPPVYVWLRLRGMVSGTPWYEFQAPAVAPTLSLSSAFIVASLASVAPDTVTAVGWTGLHSTNTAILDSSGSDLVFTAAGTYLVSAFFTRTGDPTASNCGGWLAVSSSSPTAVSLGHVFTLTAPSANLAGKTFSWSAGEALAGVNANAVIDVSIYQSGLLNSMSAMVTVVKLA